MLTERGLVKVDELSVGDCVVSWDERSNSRTVCNLTVVRHGQSTQLVRISVKGETLTCTPEHPFWGHDRGWAKAGRLAVGDRLLNANGAKIAILNIEHEASCEPVKVYNITVGGKHTFYVGKNRLLVHNKLL